MYKTYNMLPQKPIDSLIGTDDFVFDACTFYPTEKYLSNLSSRVRGDIGYQSVKNYSTCHFKTPGKKKYTTFDSVMK